ASSTRFTSDVGTRLARSSATSRISSRSLGTRWPVLADRYKNGMNRRNGARSSISRWPRAAVFVSFSSIRSHLFTATMIAARRSRRARFIRHDQPLLAEQAVHKARLAHVRPSDHRHVDLGLLARLRGRRQQVHHAVQQVARALADRRRHGKWIAQAELVEGEVSRVLGPLVGLVGDQD